jgi:hypothetical protein
MSDFKPFAQAVHDQFTFLSEHELYVVDIDPDELYAAYLAAFPPGTNEVFRERTEHDCSTCRNFIKNLGPVVAIVDGAVHTVWDTAAVSPGLEEYSVVAHALAQLVSSKPIKSLFRTDMPSYGAEKNNELGADGSVHIWHHFHGKVAAKHFSATPGAAVGEHTSAVQVFRRGLEELTPASLATVLELIDANALYRGAEFRAAVAGFQQMQSDYSVQAIDHRQIYVLANAVAPAARIRNTAIGTLLQDLSAGIELEKAVKSFEDKVSGTNYKRPTALITPRMIDDAMKTIEAEGLEPALARRLANIGDITINNVLWADNSVKPAMKGGLHGLLMEAAAPMTIVDGAKAEDISIADFLTNVLPKAHNLGLLVKNAHQGNFMTLTAPVHADVKPLFKWDNNFAFSYAGNTADSELRRRVAGAGGRVDGVLRFSHTWNYDARNASLMDLHVFMPGSSSHREGSHNNYPGGQRVGWNNRKDSLSGGVQDVDYVQAAPVGYVPVENITFPDMARLKEGKYVFKIHNWAFREPTKGGFRAEIEFGGQVYQYERREPLKNKEWVTVAEATLKDGQFTIEHRMPTTTTSQQIWGVDTETLVKVNTVLKSPNHWDGQAIGNEHVFFVLDGCKTDAPARGIYNEFLRSDLEKHRKVFEVLGNKTMCEPAAEQLSGLGFSTTKRDSVLISVTSEKSRRAYNVQF